MSSLMASRDPHYLPALRNLRLTAAVQVAARQRQKTKKSANGFQNKTRREPPRSNGTDRVAKVFNLNTYKFHRLGDYVREVLLIGRTLHTTSSPLSLFPVMLYRRLPRLVRLITKHVMDEEDWYPTTSANQTAKPSTHLPLPLRFPLFLSA